MAEFFEMPQASPTMESGTILAWKKEEGAELAPQDAIAEVETDKAAMDIEVFDKGFLLKILVEVGDDVPAGKPIAIIGTKADEDISALLEEYEKLKDAPVEAPAAEPEASPEIAEEEAPPAPSPEPAREVKAGWTPATWQGQTLPDAILEPEGSFVIEGPQVRASPIARRVARERGVDLGRVQGSGPHGRILRADVEGAGGGRVRRAPGADQKVKNSKMRRVIAKRLRESYLDNPSFFLTANFDCDNLVAFRSQLKSADIKVSYNDLTVAAVAKALAAVPECNATWGEDAITRFGSVDVGIAVAIDDGLITPIIRQADQKSLAEIGVETRDLVARARERKLQPQEYTGAGFSVSNLGMMQIEQFTALLNPPGAGILAVGSLQQEPVVKDGALGVGWRMRVTMTCDHRVIDGALGARYLQALRGFLENPVTMVV